jgi:hypothetical protein
MTNDVADADDDAANTVVPMVERTNGRTTTRQRVLSARGVRRRLTARRVRDAIAQGVVPFLRLLAVSCLVECSNPFVFESPLCLFFAQHSLIHRRRDQSPSTVIGSPTTTPPMSTRRRTTPATSEGKINIVTFFESNI